MKLQGDRMYCSMCNSYKHTFKVHDTIVKFLVPFLVFEPMCLLGNYKQKKEYFDHETCLSACKVNCLKYIFKGLLGKQVALGLLKAEASSGMIFWCAVLQPQQFVKVFSSIPKAYKKLVFVYSLSIG